MRSKAVKARIPYPLYDSVDHQISRGIIKQNAHNRIVVGSYLFQTFWGISHPFTDRYFELALEQRDVIEDFGRALNEAGEIRHKKYLNWLEKRALSGAESFEEAGRKMLDETMTLAVQYRETGELPELENEKQ